MVQFLKTDEEYGLRKFIQHELSCKYNQQIQIREDMIVTGLAGNDKIVECFKVLFYPADSNVEWIEDKIASDIHRYCFEHKICIVKSPVIERTVWNGEILYGLVYTGDAL